MIDCPWRWLNWTPKHNWRSPEAKYPTMSMEEIASLPVSRLLKPGGVAWIWATWPLIAPSAQIVEHAWHLKIKTGGAWAKRTKNGHLRVGTGFAWRSVCEPILLAVNGHGGMPRGPKLRNLIDETSYVVVNGLAREHSRKPDEAYAMCEQLTPGLRRADIFSRADRPGWDAWGSESGKYNALVDKPIRRSEPVAVQRVPHR